MNDLKYEAETKLNLESRYILLHYSVLMLLEQYCKCTKHFQEMLCLVFFIFRERERERERERLGGHSKPIKSCK